MIGALAGAALAYAVPGGLLWAFQDKLLFPAPRVAVADLDQYAEQLGVAPQRFTAADGTPLYGWYRRAEGRRAVLFFHGNGESVLGRVDLMSFLAARGWDFFVVAYRGYPGSGGAPSEAGLALDAEAAWRHLTGELGVDRDRVVVHGKSLGGGVASRLAVTVQPRALVLESTFLSVAQVAQEKVRIYPARRLLRHPFDTASRASQIRSRVLVLHGGRDELIDARHGRELAALFPGSAYVEVPSAQHGETLPLADVDAARAYVELLDAYR